MKEKHSLLDGRVHVYKRPNSDLWQCAASVNGQHFRVSTREESLSLAKDFAEDWYLELRGKLKRGAMPHGKTFAEVADQFMREYEVITAGERNPIYVEGHKHRIRAHLNPFFGKRRMSEITSGLVQEYRMHRMTSRKHKKTGEAIKPARSTMHQEIVTLRQILKTAERHQWIDHLPNLSAPYKANGKIVHRGWFSPEEYKQLYEATRRRIENPPKKRWLPQYKLLHDFVLFMGNTGLRPDEALRLEYRDVQIVTDEESKERILEIEVRGKRGVGYCKSTTGAVHPFKRLKERSGGSPTARLFPKFPRELFKNILNEEQLRIDRDGQRRTAYSLRHTYICLRLMEGADIYQIAKNCRTSVEMIEKFYASHLKNTLDASAINVRKQRGKKADSAEIPKKQIKTRRSAPEFA
jgi:integrase